MLPALRLLQAIKGWLPPDGMKLVAEAAGGHARARLRGRHLLRDVPHQEAGQVRGRRVHQPLLLAVGRGEAARATWSRSSALKAGETNEKFTLRETECLASCGTAPCLQINEDHHENLTPAKVDADLRQAP